MGSPGRESAAGEAGGADGDGDRGMASPGGRSSRRARNRKGDKNVSSPPGGMADDLVADPWGGRVQELVAMFFNDGQHTFKWGQRYKL